MSAAQPPPPPLEGPDKPPDLSELNDTDALLDRLGARFASVDDLRDPAAAALHDLLRDVDNVRRLDDSIPRLLEVLAGRPLYQVGEDESAIERDDLIRLGPSERFVIDLTDPAAAATAAAAPIKEPIDELDQPGSNVVRLPRRPAARRAEPAESGGAVRAWERTLQQVSQGAAAVVLLLALGSGVSAVVTGDPMAPVNGVTRVVSQLPGVDDSQDHLTKARTEVNLASRAVQINNPNSAKQHIANAKLALVDVPADQKAALNRAIDTVEKALPLPPTATPVPAGSMPATLPASLPASATSPPAPTPTVPVVTPSASEDPTPPPATSTPPADPTSTSPDQPSAAASPSGG